LNKKINSHLIEISNKDKILFPKSKITKLDLINYYEDISNSMIPHIKDRPIVMHRFPDGIKSSGFYQKNASDYFPKWISTITLKKEDGKVEHVLCQNMETLVYLANQACITPHIWLSKKGAIRKPDKLIFDLDPPNNDFDLVIHAAKSLKKLLEKTGLFPFVMTTGSRGLHVVVPLLPKSSYDVVRDFAKDVGEFLENTDDNLTIQTRKNKRKRRLFIDYLRNSYAQSSVAPYSIRPIEDAPVATPIDWDELQKKNMNSQYYNTKSKLISKARKKLDNMIKQ